MLKRYFSRASTLTVRLARCILLLGIFSGSAALAGSANPWLKVVTPEFTVITNLREKDAKAWTVDFAQFVTAMGAYFTGPRSSLPPLTFVVFERERDFKDYRPVDQNGKAKEVAGFFLRQDSWAVAGMYGGSVSPEVRRVIFHEGTHWFMSSVADSFPVWFGEGLAEVFSTFQMVKGNAQWGHSIPEHLLLLEQYGALPLQQLLATAQENLFGKDMSHTGRVYAQSWLFVHFMLFGEHKLDRGRLQEYFHAQESGGAGEGVFRATFGRTYGEMDRMLKQYVASGSFLIKSAPVAAPPAPTVESATAVDVANALGRLALAGGRLELASMHAYQAIAAAPTDPRGHEVLSAILLRSGKSQEGWSAMEDAERFGSKDFGLYTQMARAEQEVRKDNMSASDARRILDRYRKAIALNPGYRGGYNNFAVVVSALAFTRAEDKQTLEEGLKLFPEDKIIAIALAQVIHQQGNTEEAKARIDALVTAMAADTGKTARYARQVQAGWAHDEASVRINLLLGQRRYDEALAAMSALAESTTDPEARAVFEKMKGELRISILTRRFDEATRDQRWEEARELIAQVLESDAPLTTKGRVQQVLNQLDQRKLGLPKKP